MNLITKLTLAAIARKLLTHRNFTPPRDEDFIL
jgi:hypothetical protein